MKFIAQVDLSSFGKLLGKLLGLDKVVRSVEAACGQLVVHHRAPTSPEMSWALAQVDMPLMHESIVSFCYASGSGGKVEVPGFLVVLHTRKSWFLFFESRKEVVSFFAFDASAAAALRKVLEVVPGAPGTTGAAGWLVAALLLLLSGPLAAADMFEELPRTDLTPGAVRVSALEPVRPGCPVALVVDQAPQAGCPGPITEAEVCGHVGTREFRHVAGVTKRSVCAAYGVPASECSRAEDDHLVPLAIGGADDRANHWPQPWSAEWGASSKDWLEVELRRLVCDRRVLTLERAQRCIAQEWTLCYAQARRGDYAAMGRP